MSENAKKYLAKYDVRGIQNYIFRTSREKDAIGASAIVEDLFGKALEDAINKEFSSDAEKKNRCRIAWCNETGPLPYKPEDDSPVQVLYIGGGNAYVLFESLDTAREISKYMARYTLDNTYSLQLTSAFIEKTDDYKADFSGLNEVMNQNKDAMIVSKPLDALPVMKVERKTGFPIVGTVDVFGKKSEVSTESKLKTEAGNDKRKNDKISGPERVFDSYITKKGSDSTIAIVHIDGNDMGSRIRQLIENETDYEQAVNRMRRISYNIDHSYKEVFQEMADYYNIGYEKDNKKNYFVLKILTAGDDITYVCNAKVAVASVKMFSDKISQKGMIDDDPEGKYRFSVCAGIAFMNSHFPFEIAYQVAEECCEFAKERAKKNKIPKNGTNGMVGNWFDFQVCKNIQALDLEKARKKEYITKDGMCLAKRPYYFQTPELGNINGLDAFSYDGLMQEMKEVLNLQRTFAKEMRNTYSLGRSQMTMLKSFLESRGKTFGEDMFSVIDEKEYATYYDALELMDIGIE